MKNRPLRIAMLGHKRMPSREGGIEIVVEELSTRLAARGVEVTAYNRAGHHVSGKAFEQDDPARLRTFKGVRLKTVPTIDVKGLAAFSASFFAAICATARRYDCIHFHAEGPSAMIWLPHLFGIRTVATIHGLDWKRAKWQGFAKKFIKFGEKMAARYADELIVLNESARQYFHDEYGRETQFIPNGVTRPEPLGDELLREQWGVGKDEYLLYLSRIVPEKGLAYLIPAFRAVKTDKKLVIAGGSSDTESFFAQMKALAAGDPRIIFTDFVQGDTLRALYSNAYAYVLPSDHEGMPLTLLEAMSYGSCCLISDIEECTGVAGEHALTFRHGDQADLREKLQTLCDDPAQAAAYREGTADYICARYNWDDITERTLALYRKPGKTATTQAQG